ncbi:MAG TPA: glycosyltransferase family 4 protein [Bacteroidales bacterium]|nr:glycosyltransferase family 4 protein [Bacteroidales bacterium]HSA42059.1 glycosyltransferase family 4 protein [Bacteroidales bacterium]
MNILIVHSKNAGIVSPFILEQAESIRKTGIAVEYFGIVGKGITGYLKNMPAFRRMIREYSPDLIHAHYGLSGLFANLQREIPVITTFHGSDLADRRARQFSLLARRLSAASVFVSQRMTQFLPRLQNPLIIPCGVDTAVFGQLQAESLPKPPAIVPGRINVLFSSAFSKPVKNAALAHAVCRKAEAATGKKISLIELKAYTRPEVNALMMHADCLLMTSLSEGSPQFIKEGMACSRPIVSTDVGDVRWLTGDTAGCFVSAADPELLAGNLVKALEFKETRGREHILSLGLDLESIAHRLTALYEGVLHEKRKTGKNHHAEKH